MLKIKPRKILSLELNFSSDEGILCSGLELCYKNKFLIISKTLESIDFDDFLSNLDKKIPVIININGKGIIAKSLKHVGAVDEKNLISQILPDVNIDDLYFSTTKMTDDNIFIAIVRRKLLDLVFKKLHDSHITVLKLNIGINDVVEHIHLLKIDNGEINTNYYQIFLEEGKLKEVKIKSVAQTYFDINNTQLGSHNILTFFSGISFFTADTLESELPYINSNLEKFYYEQLTKGGLVFSLSFFLLLLLINFFAFEYYSSKVNQLKNKNINQLAHKAKISEVVTEIEKKQDFFISANINKKWHTSYVLDRIGLSLPPNIFLKELLAHPLEKDFFYDEKIVFKFNVIRLIGETKNSSDLNNWLISLKKEEWLKSIEIINFDHKVANKRGNFVIDLYIDSY